MNHIVVCQEPEINAKVIHIHGYIFCNFFDCLIICLIADLGSHSWPGSSSGVVAPVKDRISTSIAGLYS